MAGVKGRSGGARRNAGGARVGAGRKKVDPTFISSETAKTVPGEPLDPRPALELVALGRIEVSPNQMKALTVLLPYVHRKSGESGKKEEKEVAAKSAGAGKFASSAAPLKLVRPGHRP